MERYFKIGELSRLYGIGTDSIRYYEELGLISPTRGDNGYRLYNIRDIWRMNVIRDLRSLGFSMDGIREYLTQHSVERTISLLQQEQEEIDRKMAQLKRMRASVSERLVALENTRTLSVGVVEQTYFPHRYCHEIHQAFTSDEEMDVLTKRLLNQIHNRLYIIGNTLSGGRLSQEGLRQGQYNHYSGVFIIDEGNKQANSFLEAGDYLVLRYRGLTRQNSVYIPQLMAYAESHGLVFSGEVHELIHIDIHETGDTREHLTELQARVLMPDD